MSRWRELLLGARDRMGWWTLPMFLAVALMSAVLAGTLSVIYYASQVDALREETRSARDEATRAREEIREATDDALATINEQVDAVRQSLTTELPVPDAFEAGIVAIRAFPGPPPQPEPSGPPEPSPSPEPSPGTSPSPQGSPAAAQGPAVARSRSANQEQPPPAQEEQPPPPEQEQPPPPPPRGQPRFGSGFPVVREGGATFIATSFEVVESPFAPGRVVPEIEVVTRNATLPAVLHSFDRDLDLALLRVGVELPVPEWRPLDAPLEPGDKLWAAGLTPTLNTAQVAGSIAVLDPEVVVTDIVILDFLRGGPLVDIEGRVVGVATSAYRPFGGEESEGHAAVPIRALCAELLTCPAGSDEDASTDG